MPVIAVFMVAALVFIIGGSALQAPLASVLSWINIHLDWAYLWVYAINFIFLIYLAVSRFGNIKLGSETDKPKYSNFKWGAMVFATAIDASIMMLSMVDPLRMIQHPSYGSAPMSKGAFAMATVFGQFNWGPMAWMMFAPATILVGYILYRKRGHVQRLSDGLEVLQGKGRGKTIGRNVVDLLVVFGIMGGIGSSIGMEVPVISKVLSGITGWTDNLTLKSGLFFFLFIIFAVTVFHGLNGGIDKLSEIHIWLAILFLLLVFLIGPTRRLIGSEFNSVGLFVQKFVPMSFGMHHNFGQQNTLFYWGWWLSYMPIMGLFIAQISRGRTIRQVLVGMLTYGAGGCASFYAVLGGYTLWIQQTGVVDLVHVLNTQGQAAVIAAVIGTLPMKTVMMSLYCVSCFIFLATTISGSAYILASFTSTPLHNQEPSRFNRMSWVVVFMLFSFGIMLVGGFNAVQTVSVIAGFPLIGVCLITLFSIWKLVKKDPVILAAKESDLATKRRRESLVERRSAIHGHLILSPNHATN
nr:BCCT family transporter [Secundilactobacillus malefermentans]